LARRFQQLVLTLAMALGTGASALAQSSPGPSPSPLNLPAANLPQVSPPSMPCVPGPPTRVRLVDLRRIGLFTYLVRLLIDDPNVAPAVLARDGQRLADADALAKRHVAGGSDEWIGNLHLTPGRRYDFSVRGWEYISADSSCWNRLNESVGSRVAPR
jgi:hypothetical protein